MYHLTLRLLTLLTPLLVALGLFIWNQKILNYQEAGFILLAALAGLLPMLFMPRATSASKPADAVLKRLEHQAKIIEPPTDLANRLQAIEYNWQHTSTRLQNRLKGRLAILEHLPQPLLMVDNRINLVRANAAGRQMLDIPPNDNEEDVSGKPLRSVLRHADVLAAVEACKDEDISETLEIIHNTHYYSVQIEPVPVRPFLRTRIIISFTDITAIRLNEQANANFVAHASHELRTPLTAIIGFIETLQGPAAADIEARQNFLELMHTESSRMRRLINDLLSLSRLDSHQPSFKPVQVQSIIESVVNLLANKAEQKHMSIHFNNEYPATVNANADLLTQIFQNLVDNAIRYGKEKTTIEVHLKQEGQHVIVSVTNKGAGIPRGEIPKIINRFYRSNNAAGIEGTGLGLSIVKQAVEKHQGKLSIDSEPGAWSRFQVSLPL